MKPIKVDFIFIVKSFTLSAVFIAGLLCVFSVDFVKAQKQEAKTEISEKILEIDGKSMPKAPVREVSDVYFGTKVIDPYRLMEDLKNPEVVAWMKAQADYTRAHLDSLPIRQELLKRLNELGDAGVRVSGIQRAGNLYFYYRVAPGENDRKVFVRKGLDSTERLIIDPEKLSADGKHYSIDFFKPSFDGKYVLYIFSADGSKDGEMRLIETATGRDTGERLKRPLFNAVSWLPDGRSFLYNQVQKLPASTPTTKRSQEIIVYQHTLGMPLDADKAIFGTGVNPNIKFDAKGFPFVFVPPGSKYAMALVNPGVSPNSEWYIAPLEAFKQTPIPWRKIAAFQDEILNSAIHGDDIYLLTSKNAPRYEVIRMSLTNPDLSKATTVFPESEAVVKNISAARDALYVQTLDGGIGRLWRVDYEGGAPQPVRLPYDGSASIGWTDPETDGILFSLGSWTKSNAYFAYNPKTGSSKDTKLIPPIPVDMSDIEVTTAKIKSYDGTMVPMVVLYKRGLKRNGANPTLINGYGAYGFANTSPIFNPSFLTWLERGGILAFAGVRGGGEYGEEWHLAGKGATKPNTWKDFIACAEYLVREKYTSPQHLAGQGVSAGGILIGNAIAERPDLFGAAIIEAGVNNVLRMETTPNGPLNIAEFGSTKTEAGFKALIVMDAYHKIEDGVKYPAVLLMTGINDTRVEPWMSAKIAARLQAASASGKPILLRVDYDGGHGSGSAKNRRNEQLADTYAFLFQRLGVPKTKTTKK